MSRYGNTKKCAELSPAEFENLFYYPGPALVRTPPTLRVQKIWNQAKDEICLECPVFVQCREQCWGEEYGVVGGTDQYERFLYRRNLQRKLKNMSPAERAQLAARIVNKYGMGYRVPLAEIARRTGYSQPALRALMAEHQAVIDAMKPAKPAPVKRLAALSAEELEQIRGMALKGKAPRFMATVLGRSLTTVLAVLGEMDLGAARDKPAFPKQRPPKSDAWVWHHGIVRTAHYLGQTEDGQWLYMSLRGTNKSPTRKWFASNCVDLRTQVPVQIVERRGANAA